jgi:hypothetical protein
MNHNIVHNVQPCIKTVSNTVPPPDTYSIPVDFNANYGVIAVPPPPIQNTTVNTSNHTTSNHTTSNHTTSNHTTSNNMNTSNEDTANNIDNNEDASSCRRRLVNISCAFLVATTTCTLGVFVIEMFGHEITL